jgi:HK97 family phage prohead protease
VTQTVYGILADELGHARRPELRKAWATPAAEVRSVQAPRIPVDRDHDHRWCGELIHLERAGGNLWAVAEVDDSVTSEVHVRVGSELRSAEVPMYWSATRRGGDDYGIELLSVALTPTPARVAARPVTFREGRAHLAAGRTSDPFERALLKRAAEAQLTRHGRPIVVHGGDPFHRVHEEEPREAPFRTSRLEIRSAAAVDVHPARRELDLLIAPAERPATIHERGRSYLEVFAHGAFEGCQRDPERIRVNLHHAREKTIGKAVALNPWDEVGLTGTVRLSKVRDADDALELAADGVLSVSAGFAVPDGGDEWHRGGRIIRSATLDHIALTPAPAHSTAVLAVRDRLATR